MSYIIKSKTGALIQRMRENRGLTRKEVADYCDISEQAIGAIERGQYLPSLNTACDLAELFDCDITDFVIRRNEPKLLPENALFDFTEYDITMQNDLVKTQKNLNPGEEAERLGILEAYLQDYICNRANFDNQDSQLHAEAETTDLERLLDIQINECCAEARFKMLNTIKNIKLKMLNETGDHYIILNLIDDISVYKDLGIVRFTFNKLASQYIKSTL